MYELPSGFDGADDDFLEFSLWIVLLVSNLDDSESRLGKAGEPSFRIFSPQNEALGGNVQPPFIRMNAGPEVDFRCLFNVETSMNCVHRTDIPGNHLVPYG